MRSIIITLLTLLSIAVSVSQKLPYGDLINEPDWHEGSILLSDETELIGLINFNDMKGTISFESGSHSRTYTARNVIGFEFHDSRTGKQRVFYSLEYNDDRAPNSGPFIFEVLRNMRSFTVLYKADPLDFENVQSWENSGVPAGPGYPQSQTYRNYTNITQNETVYLLTEEQEIVPIIEMTSKQSQGRLIDRSRTKSKGKNIEAIEKCMGEAFAEVEAYAKAHGLKFSEEEHLLILLDYYWDITN